MNLLEGVDIRRSSALRGTRSSTRFGLGMKRGVTKLLYLRRTAQGRRNVFDRAVPTDRRSQTSTLELLSRAFSEVAPLKTRPADAEVPRKHIENRTRQVPASQLTRDHRVSKQPGFIEFVTSHSKPGSAASKLAKPGQPFRAPHTASLSVAAREQEAGAAGSSDVVSWPSAAVAKRLPKLRERNHADSSTITHSNGTTSRPGASAQWPAAPFLSQKASPRARKAADSLVVAQANGTAGRPEAVSWPAAHIPSQAPKSLEKAPADSSALGRVGRGGEFAQQLAKQRLGKLSQRVASSPQGVAIEHTIAAGEELRTDAESQQSATAAPEEEQGSREQEKAAELEESKARLKKAVFPDVLVVDDVEEANRICTLLLHQYRSCIFACDTEVAFIDVSCQSPCGHGQVICFSVYGGEDVHLAKDPPVDGRRKSTLWVDTYCGGENEEKATALLAAFKPFFEASHIRKVWHNYSFDRHVLANMGIHCQGFAGDTMHMARLFDSSRKGTKTYSLASLTGDSRLMANVHSSGQDVRGKITMKELFGEKNVTKNGKEGKLVVVPSVEQLQMDPATRDGWINYSAFDAKSTHQLQQALQDSLSNIPCEMDSAVSTALGVQPGKYSMWDMYQGFWMPFGELLTDMEKEGMLVNREHLATAEEAAKRDQKLAQDRFREWAKERVPDAEFMNVGSGAQIRQLLFAGVANNRPDKQEHLELERTFKAPNVNNIIEEGKKVPKKNIDITLHSLWGRNEESKLEAEVHTPSGWPAVSTPVLRSLAGKPGAARAELDKLVGNNGGNAEGPSISDVAAFTENDLELEDEWNVTWDEIYAARQKPSNGSQVASMRDERQKAAMKAGLGRLYSAFGGGQQGLAACAAVDALCEVGAVDTLLSNFIVPLQEEHIATKNPDGTLGRVHCSLNINTETGRLSARRPNLQNQPALEKDRYKVRRAFTADVTKGNTLVVADYGQLELRLLAHMTNCESMLRAFKAGGDFHSRTALGMYDHIQAAIKNGECLLEWDGPPGTKSDIPLLKDKFASERRKAKVLNFSIAYGKTAHGLSKDWKVDIEEAQETVNRWYSDRPEVLVWQKEQQRMAETKGYVLTMLGRRRNLPDASAARGKAKGHAMRAAINTPIQGSAADVATAAMLAIHRCPRLHQLGWKLLLQVHDEVILEGPKESAAEAKSLVVEHMERPFNGVENPLKVALTVDAKSADTWYEAK